MTDKQDEAAGASEGLAHLQRSGLIKPVRSSQFLRVSTPCILTIGPEVCRKILRKLPKEVESGGVLACRVQSDGTERILAVEKVIWLENISDEPRHSYAALPQGRLEAVLAILARRMIPIYFHTHPVRSRIEMKKLLHYFFQMGTSEADQHLSERAVSLGGSSFVIPCAILIKDVQFDDGFFVGVYGGMIAPKNFEEEIAKAGTETLLDYGEAMYQFAKEKLCNPKVRAVAVVAGLGGLALCVAYPKAAANVFGVLFAGLSFGGYRLFPLHQSRIGYAMRYFGVATVSHTVRIKLPSVQEAH